MPFTEPVPVDFGPVYYGIIPPFFEFIADNP